MRQPVALGLHWEEAVTKMPGSGWSAGCHFWEIDTIIDYLVAQTNSVLITHVDRRGFFLEEQS